MLGWFLRAFIIGAYRSAEERFELRGGFLGIHRRCKGERLDCYVLRFYYLVDHAWKHSYTLRTLAHGAAGAAELHGDSNIQVYEINPNTLRFVFCYMTGQQMHDAVDYIEQAKPCYIACEYRREPELEASELN